MRILQIEYVAEDDTLADISLKEATSASLRTSNAIILAILLISSFILNMILISAVLTSKKLRESLIYVMYAHLSFVNIIDLIFTVLISLIFVANGAWVLGDSWCHINATMQEFCQLYILLSIMLMAVERAVGVVTGTATLPPDQREMEGAKLLNGKRILVLSLSLAVVAIAISIPIATSVIPVKEYKSRYVCAVDSGAPLGYPIARMVIYCGSLCVLLMCIGAILRKREMYSLPSQSHEYSDFVKRNRAMQDHISRAKLVIFLLCVFILFEGPYILLCFTYEICNSNEIMSNQLSLEVPQDVDTLITWLKFVFPLLCPIIMFCWCNDIWITVKEIFCCRSYDPPTIGHYMNGNKGVPGAPGVITLVATAEGLQLKLPTSTHQQSSQNLIPASICPTPSTYNSFLSTKAIPNTESSISVAQPPKNKNSNLEPEVSKTNQQVSRAKKTKKKQIKTGTKESSQKTVAVSSKNKVPSNAGGVKRRPAPKSARIPAWK